MEKPGKEQYEKWRKEANRIVREHRAYKHGLMVQGLLEE